MRRFCEKTWNALPPEKQARFNEIQAELAQLAMDNYVYYLDLDEGLTDETGLVRDEYVGDGLHFGPTGTHALEDYIKTHVVRRNWYVKEVCE